MRLSKGPRHESGPKRCRFEPTMLRGRRIRLVRMLAKNMARSGYDAYIYPDYLGASRSSCLSNPIFYPNKELAGFFTQADRCSASSRPARIAISSSLLLYRMLYGCGLRNLKLNLTVRRVDRGKENTHYQERQVSQGQACAHELHRLTDRCRAYMDTIHAVSQPEDVFFPSTHGGRYSARRIYDYFRRFLWGAGISHGGRARALVFTTSVIIPSPGLFQVAYERWRIPGFAVYSTQHN